LRGLFAFRKIECSGHYSGTIFSKTADGFFLPIFVLGCKMFHQNTGCILIIFTNLFSCIWHPAQGFPSIFITSSNFFDNFPAIQTTIKKGGIFDMILHTERYSVRNDARKQLCNILSGLGMI